MPRQPGLRLGADVRGQRTFQCGGDVGLHVVEAGRADDRRVTGRVRQGEPQDERVAAHPFGELLEAGLLPCRVPIRVGPVSQADAAANKDAGPGIGGVLNHLLVAALEGGIRYLEGVEDPRSREFLQIRRAGGDPDEAGLPGPADFLEGLGQPPFLDLFHRGVVHLQQIDAVRSQAAQALVDVGAQAVRGPQVPGLQPVSVEVDVAAALGGEEELVAAVAYVSADTLLAGPVVRGGVDEVDAGVEGGVQHGAGLVVVVGRVRQAAFAGSEAELRDLEAGASKQLFGQIVHLFFPWQVQVRP